MRVALKGPTFLLLALIIILLSAILAVFSIFSHALYVMRYSRPVSNSWKNLSFDVPLPVRTLIDIPVPNSRGTIFTCVSPNFYYVKHFLYIYTLQGYNVHVFVANSIPLNGQVLPVHWCRVYLLYHQMPIGPPPLIYSDSDTRVNLTELERWIPPHRHFDGIIIMNGTVHVPMHNIRTNWFVLPKPRGSRTRRVISLWATNARNVGLQDQFVINELYKRCEEKDGLLCRHYKEGGITSWHCNSHNINRAACMHDVLHLKERIPTYIRSK